MVQQRGEGDISRSNGGVLWLTPDRSIASSRSGPLGAPAPTPAAPAPSLAPAPSPPLSSTAASPAPNSSRHRSATSRLAPSTALSPTGPLGILALPAAAPALRRAAVPSPATLPTAVSPARNSRSPVIATSRLAQSTASFLLSLHGPNAASLAVMALRLAAAPSPLLLPTAASLAPASVRLSLAPTALAPSTAMCLLGPLGMTAPRPAATVSRLAPAL